MTQNIRYETSLRRDVQQVARSTGGSAACFFWGSLTVLGVLFWPNIFVHGPHRLACEIGWYGFLGAIVLSVLIASMMATAPRVGPRRPRPKTGVPLTPPPSNGPWPDLRQSGEFTGKRQ